MVCPHALASRADLPPSTFWTEWSLSGAADGFAYTGSVQHTQSLAGRVKEETEEHEYARSYDEHADDVTREPHSKA